MLNSSFNNKQSGFTLIELMVTIMIISIIATIAIPNYTKYMVKNAEDDTLVQMKILELQLEKWKASRLTYRNFIPNRGPDICATDGVTACYDNANNIDIYSPKGSDANNYKYKITVVDIGDSTTPSTSLVPVAPAENAADQDVNVTAGRGWRIIAVPKEDGPAKSGFKFMVTSTGVQCKTRDPAANAITKDSINCGSHNSVEQI